MEIVKNNPEIQSPRDFHDWVRKNYASAVAIHIRRELDIGSDVVSLKRLLTQIQKNPQIITKEWFKSMYKGSNAEDFAGGDFQNVARVGEIFYPFTATAFSPAYLTRMWLIFSNEAVYNPSSLS